MIIQSCVQKRTSRIAINQDELRAHPTTFLHVRVMSGLFCRKKALSNNEVRDLTEGAMIRAWLLPSPCSPLPVVGRSSRPVTSSRPNRTLVLHFKFRAHDCFVNT